MKRADLFEGSNGMMEALILWESIVNSQWFTKTNIILFANKWGQQTYSSLSGLLADIKIDLLADKIKKPDQQIQPYFPDFQG